MKQANRIWIMSVCVIACLFGARHWFHAGPVYAQRSTQPPYDDGTFYISATVNVDSNYILHLDSYMDVAFDTYEDIDGIRVYASADEDGQIYYSAYGDGDNYTAAIVSLQSDSPVATGHEYGLRSNGYACYDVGEEQCGPLEYIGSAYASVNVASAPPHIDSLSPSSVNQGDQGTLTISGSNLVENSTDQLSINYSGSGMPFELTGTPSSRMATFSYDFSGYSVGTYTVSVTNNEGTSNGVSFTVNPPTNACSQSTVPNSFAIQIARLGNGSGTFTVAHPTAMEANAATTVSYGPFSTPSSVASGIASAMARNYLSQGVTVQSDGPNVNVQSRSAFGSISASSPGSTFSVGVASAVSCIVRPVQESCLGLNPDYDYSRSYTDGNTVETPRAHITRKHIMGPPTTTPLNTVYVGTNATDAQVFTLIQRYWNLTTVLLNPKISGRFRHTFSKRSVEASGGFLDFGRIGRDAAGNDLYTDLVFLTLDRCKVITSYPEAIK